MMRVVVSVEQDALARALRDAGIEVVLTGAHASADHAARAAVHEDADVLVVDDELATDARRSLAGYDAADVLVVPVSQLPAEELAQWLRDHLAGTG